MAGTGLGEGSLRNKLISKTFYARGFIETWSTGTNKIVDLCRLEGIPEPKFLERSGGIVVIFKLKERMRMVLEEKKFTPLSSRQASILKILEEKGELPLKK